MQMRPASASIRSQLALAAGVLCATALFVHSTAFAISSPAPAWSYVLGSDSNSGFACRGASKSCTIQLQQPTSAGAITVVGIVALTTTSTHITAVCETTSKCSGNGTGWMQCPSAACEENTNDAKAGVGDVSYNLNDAGRFTSITVAISAGPGAGHEWLAASGQWKCSANCGTTSLASNCTTNGCRAYFANCTSTCSGPLFPSLTARSSLLVVNNASCNPTTVAAPWQKSLPSNSDWYYEVNANPSAGPPQITTRGCGQFTGLAFQ